jgi:hypothetical protein
MLFPPAAVFPDRIAAVEVDKVVGSLKYFVKYLACLVVVYTANNYGHYIVVIGKKGEQSISILNVLIKITDTETVDVVVSGGKHFSLIFV